MRALVTGGSGFIGSELIRQLGPDFDILNVDTAVGRDMRQPNVLQEITRFRPSYVFHLAARHVIPWCIEHPVETLDSNVLAFEKVLAAARNPHLHFVALASSASVYGYSEQPFRETDDLAPADIYGISKATAEEVLRQFVRGTRIRAAAARFFNVVGPGDSQPHILSVIADHARSGETLTLGTLEPVRDYVHKADVASALIHLAGVAPEGVGAYNIGTGRGTSIGRLLELVPDCSYRVDPTLARASDGTSVADVREMERLGWRAERTLEQSIKDVL